MPTPAACLTSEERAHIIQLLNETEGEFLRLTSGLTDRQWTWQPASAGWSVQGIAEHLVLGERAMLSKAAEALSNPPHPGWEEQAARKTSFLERVLPEVTRKATAPAPLAPHHDWTRDQTMAQFREGRARTLTFVADVHQPVKMHLAEHPFPIFNLLNAYHWLLYIPLHNIRHNRQIADTLKEALMEVAP